MPHNINVLNKYADLATFHLSLNQVFFSRIATIHYSDLLFRIFFRLILPPSSMRKGILCVEFINSHHQSEHRNRLDNEEKFIVQVQ